MDLFGRRLRVLAGLVGVSHAERLHGTGRGVKRNLRFFFCDSTVRVLGSDQMATKSELCKRIEARRLHLGISMTTIAARVGCTVEAVKAWCAGANEPQIRYLRPLAAALHCHPLYLLGVQDQPGSSVDEYFAV